MIRNFISKLYSLYTPSFFMSGGGSSSGYVIERSLRFSSASSQYLSRTQGAGSATTFTWSGLIKCGVLGTAQHIINSGNSGTSEGWLRFNAADQLNFQDGTNADITTTTVFRDPSAWYYVTLCVNTSNATAADRVIIYVNNVRQAVSGTHNGSNLLSWNKTGEVLAIGRFTRATSNYFDGYLTETIWVDGQALTPSSFGETNTATGQWVAKKYTGTYGTNGFYLDFKDGTSTTTLGYDKSGNNNHWALTNFTRSAGVNDCWMLDVPAVNGSASAVQPSGNYAVLNPLWKGSVITITSGNLNATSSGVGGSALSTIPMSTGKWYAEVTINTGSDATVIGIVTQAFQPTSSLSGANAVGYYSDGTKFVNGVNTSYGVSYTTGDVIAILLDVDAGTVTFYKNNTPQSAIAIGLTGEFYFATSDISSGSNINQAWNFGQRSFAYTPPTGFKALCTANLTSTDVIESGSFTGNASADGRYVWCNGTPETLTINGNAVTWGTHADRLSNGFKLRTSSSSYNSSGTNTWTATILSPESKSAFKHQNAKGN